MGLGWVGGKERGEKKKKGGLYVGKGVWGGDKKRENRKNKTDGWELNEQKMSVKKTLKKPIGRLPKNILPHNLKKKKKKEYTPSLQQKQ